MRSMPTGPGRQTGRFRRGLLEVRDRKRAWIRQVMVMIAVIWFALVWMMLRFFTALVTPGKVEKEYEDREQEQFLAELSRRMES